MTKSFLRKSFFIFLLSILFFSNSLFAQSLEEIEKNIPQNLILAQKNKWKDFEVRLYTNQKQLLLVYPLEIYVLAYDPNLKMAFTGNMNLAIESLTAQHYRETPITEKDQIVPGLYKLTYPFEKTGEYLIKVNLMALDGDFFPLEARVEVIPSDNLMNYQKTTFYILCGLALIFAAVYFIRKRKTN